MSGVSPAAVTRVLLRECWRLWLSVRFPPRRDAVIKRFDRKEEGVMDWDSMSPREVWEAKRSAPKLVAGPWTAFPDGSGFGREDDASNMLAMEWLYEGAPVVRVLAPVFLRVTTRTDAESVLVAAGYIVVDPTETK